MFFDHRKGSVRWSSILVKLPIPNEPSWATVALATPFCLKGHAAREVFEEIFVDLMQWTLW